MHSFFEKIDVFNNIKFVEYNPATGRRHQYIVDGAEQVSVTKVIGSVEPPFDEIAKAPGSAKKYNETHGTNITPQEMIDIWHMNNLIAREKGTAVHKYIECAISNKVENYPAEHMAEVFGTECISAQLMRPVMRAEFGNFSDPVYPRYNKIIGHVDRFLNDIRGKMYPVKSEVVIGSPKYRVCGMVDQIFYNTKSGKFEIWDWKTNREFRLESNFHCLAPVEHLTNSKIDEYSLQLSCYKKMFREMTGIELGNCYLCWFSELESNYKVFKCKDLEKEAALLLERAAGGLV